MKKVISLLKKKYPDVRVFVSIAPSLRAVVSAYDEDENFSFYKGSSLDLMNTADVAVVTSGTATLECALCKTPMMVMYKMNKFSFYIARFLVNVPYIGLVNFVAGKKIVNEFVQNFSAEEVFLEIERLLYDQSARASLVEELNGLDQKVISGTSENAVNAILESGLVESL
jgi:lipid-A-disaccharide synthase